MAPDDRICPDGPGCPDRRCRLERLLAGLPVDPPVPLYTALCLAGVPLTHHESDLYAEATEAAKRIIPRYPEQSWTTFRDATTNRLSFDLPFAYLPWWATRKGAAR